MKGDMYVPNGELQGDTKAMPDRGTSTGVAGNVATEGMSLERDATNRRGSAKTSPDPMFDRTPGDEGTPGDRD